MMDHELASVSGGGDSDVPPVEGQAQWNDLLFRLAWEWKNDPYHRER
jgi:hypothetical protein